MNMALHLTVAKTKKKTKTKTKTITKTKTKWLKDPTCAIFLKMLWLKDVKYDDGGWISDASGKLMHQRWCTGVDSPSFFIPCLWNTSLTPLDPVLGFLKANFVYRILISSGYFSGCNGEKVQERVLQLSLSFQILLLWLDFLLCGPITFQPHTSS